MPYHRDPGEGLDYKLQTPPPITSAIAPLEGQTTENLLDALREFLEERLKDYRLPVKQEGWNNQPIYRPVEVQSLYMDDPDEDHERIPYILLQPLNGKDERTDNGQMDGRVNVRIVITIFNENLREGRAQILHIIQTIRRELIRAGVVGKSFDLKWPLEWLIYPDDTGNYHMGEMSTTWGVPTEERSVPELRNEWQKGLKW